jgi:hypothetical protein
MATAIEKIKVKDSGLCKEKTVAKPTMTANSFEIASAVGAGLFICAIIGAIVGGVFGHLYAAKEQYFNADLYNLPGIFFGLLSYAVGIVLGAIAGGIAGIFIGLIIGIICKAVEQKRVIDYNALQNAKYKDALKAEEKRIAEEGEKRKFLRSVIDLLNKKLAESMDNTQKLYDAVGIDRTYRNLICMGYMDEYIRLGIATKLGGVDGLYFVIKQQLNFDQINANLNVIIKKLDVIIDKQTQIYNAIQTMNFRCSQMVGELEKISYNTYSLAADSAFNTYCDERYHQEMEYLNYVNA